MYRGRVFKMKEHLDRLFDSARAMGFGHCSGAGDPALVPSRAYVEDAIRATMAANGVCLLSPFLSPSLPPSLSPSFSRMRTHIISARPLLTGMLDDCHMRVTLSRGPKVSFSMHLLYLYVRASLSHALSH
jgi:hypothetical protein